MKRKLAALVILTIGLSACHSNGQQPPSPPVYTCPAATGSAYAEINPPASTSVPASITATTYKWTPPSVGAWCAVVQAWGLPAGATVYQASVASNIVQPTTTTADPVVNFSWTAPATTATYSSYTYILSYAPAVQAAVPLAPPLSQPTETTSELIKPSTNKMPAPTGLVAVAAR